MSPNPIVPRIEPVVAGSGALEAMNGVILRIGLCARATLCHGKHKAQSWEYPILLEKVGRERVKYIGQNANAPCRKTRRTGFSKRFRKLYLAVNHP